MLYKYLLRRHKNKIFIVRTWRLIWERLQVEGDCMIANLMMRGNITNIQSYNLKMERSMVQQLNGLSGSQFVNNRSTFISTAFNEGDYELRKSRIQNLPSYRKEDMSAKVNFVVVFQSIQIQRLSNQVEALRVALKDAQRQNFNVHNYEIQIRQLTEKCFAYEREREEYRDQIDKLNMICEKLYEQLQTMKSRFADIDPTIKEKYRLERERTQKLEEEFEKWRARYSALEVSKNREMEDMRLMMESQRKSMMDREIKELSLKFSSERQNLEKEIRKLREGLDAKDSELQRVNSKISQLEILNQELRRYENTIDDYENKFAMISQETVRLNDLLRHKQEEIDKQGSEINNLKRRLSEYERKLREAEEGGEKVRILDDQIRDWKTRYSKLEDQNREYKQQLSKIPEFQQVIQQISKESDRLKDAVRQKMGEVDDWRGKYQRVDAQYKQTKVQQEKQVPALENKIGQLNSQNDRLNNALKTRAGEIETWRNKCSDFQKQLSRIPAMEQDKKNLQNQMNNQTRQINEFQSYIRQLEPQARRLGEIERDLTAERQDKQECKRQIDRLNNGIRGLSEKSENLERKCGALERELKTFTQIQEELRVYKQKEINLTKEIDRINGIIIEKIKEIQSLKELFQKYEKGLSQYQGIQKKLLDSVNQTQKLIHDLDERQKQNGVLQDKLIQIESESRKLKNDVFVINQEKEQMVKLLNSKVQELEQSKMEASQLQHQISQLRQKQARLREIEEKLRVTEVSLADIDRKFKSQLNRTRDLTMNLDQTSAQLNKIKREGMMSPKFKQQFFQLRSQTQQRQRQFRSLQQRLSTMQGLFRKLRQALTKQDQIAKKNNERFGQIGKQFDASAQAMKRMFDMQNQMMKLNQDILQLQGKLRILSVQNGSLKQTYGNKGLAAVQVETDQYRTGVSRNSGYADNRAAFGGGALGLTNKKSETSTSQYETAMQLPKAGSGSGTSGFSSRFSNTITRTSSSNNLGSNLGGIGGGAGVGGNTGNIGMSGMTGMGQNWPSSQNFANMISTSSVSSFGSSNIDQFNLRNSGQPNTSFNLGGMGSPTNRTETLANFDLFRKIQQEQPSTEPLRFQFRTSSINKPDN